MGREGGVWCYLMRLEAVFFLSALVPLPVERKPVVIATLWETVDCW